ncbi:MAG: BlaI/MecI/CopY family transcriptional regulator, partial [Lachnospiraceae bacterium]|nr:BlaI/MecI/CopY family transcriptional regulator [Lachnospiraceae bacterium]
MGELRMGTAEAKFADMIWDNEPVSSGDLAKLANKEFEWKKTTAFTVLKRLCERGLFQNQNGIVTSLISKEEFYARHSETYVEETFGGSLPAFL